MKTFLKLLLVSLCCAPLLITDAMAREVGRGGGSRASASKPSSRQVSRPASRPTVRPSSRPATQASRNPITQSKVSRPSAKPAPQYRPQAKPSTPQKPTAKPNPRPTVPSKPSTRPETKPNPPNRPAERPANKPQPPEKPGNNPGSRPNTPNRPNEPSRPGANQPGKNERPLDASRPVSRPDTKPGNVTYPGASRPNNNRPDDNRPGTNRPENQRPGNNLPNRPGYNRPVVSKPGQNSRPIKKPDFDRPTASRPGQSSSSNWWNSGHSNNRPNNRSGIGNNNQWGNNVHINNNNIHINNNFKNNVNWSTNRKNWGYNPWWNRPATRPWYGGSWNCGWSNSYYRRNYHHYHYYGGYRPLPGYVVYEDNRNDVAQAIGWGLVGWSLGKLIFDSGYQTYTNPYPAQPVQSSTGSQVTYTQPITVVAAQTAPTEEQAATVTEISESHMASSQEAFKQGNYLRALEGTNKAVGEAPGDGALHEYRALVLFALGKFSEAAGVLNPVLAGGPGWDWTTMITLYPNQEAYMTQLAALESYAKSKPDAADARFLLGYHYMVCGHLEQANAEFSTAARLQPADSVSSQLRDLTAASSNNGDEDAVESTEPATDDVPAPTAPVPLEKLTGTWVSDKGAQGTVSLAFMDEGKFIWTFRQGEKSNEFGGDFSINDNGLLVLDAEESQMVATVELPTDGELKFVLAGGPPGDPGLLFARK